MVAHREGSGGDASVFTGTWTCTQTTTVAGQPKSSVMNVLVISGGSGGQLLDIATGEADGGICSLTATPSGDTAQLTPNQTCPTANAGGPLTFTSGTITVSGSALSYTTTLADTAGTVSIDGACTRL